MVISPDKSTTSSSSSSQQPNSPTVSDPLPPSSGFTFAVSKPRSKRHPLIKSDSEPRRWNLRSRNGTFGNDHTERPRFSVALSGDEIAEDLYAVTGSMPRRRPKKRPRLVQKYIDMVFPGTWLKEITLELYKVSDQR